MKALRRPRYFTSLCVALFVLVSGCTFSYSRPVKPELAETCPDFSGSYAYPGIAQIDAVCPHRSTWPDLAFPGEGGFMILADAPHTIVIRQDGCETLTIRGRSGPTYLGAPPEGFPDEVVLSLVRRRKADRVEWGQDSLFWRRKFKPAGAIIFPVVTINYMEMWLKLERGGLRYRLRHVENNLRRDFLAGEIECFLPLEMAL